MLRYITGLLALAAATLLSVAPAPAEGIFKSRSAAPREVSQEWSWSGVYLDLGAGGQAAIHNLDIHDATLDGLGAWNWLGNARVGVNFQPQGSPLVFGIFGGYSLGSVAVEAEAGGQTQLDAELTPTWDVGAIVGISGPNKSLIYGGYKYQMAEVDISGAAVDGECTAPGVRCSFDMDGHGLIAGVKMPVTPAFVMGIEYGYTQFDTERIADNLDVDSELHTVMLRGSVLLGPNLFGN